MYFVRTIMCATLLHLPSRVSLISQTLKLNWPLPSFSDWPGSAYVQWVEMGGVVMRKLGSMTQPWVVGKSVFPWAKPLFCHFPYCSLLSWQFSMASSPLILVQQRLMFMLCMREEVPTGTGKELFNKKAIIDQWLQSGHLLILLSLSQALCFNDLIPR